jgi:hypothetical protein
MKIELTDQQVARLFQLCAEILAVRDSVPSAPQGFDLNLEIARIVRANLEKHSAAMEELGQLLHISAPPSTGE